MPDQKIFCNVPWTSTHIYWDGSFGACCGERHRPYPIEKTSEYNIKNYTVSEWFNQIPLQDFRKKIHDVTALSNCERCYKEEKNNYESKRLKENFKSVIFTEQAFEKSYQQSPGYEYFESSKLTGLTSKIPIDWHVDLGNECNLACKMCYPEASSKIANHYKSWNIINNVTNKNWTKDEKSWNNFLTSIKETPNLNRLHLMGGEPMLNKKFYHLIDFLLENNRTEISISFVTNGTLLDQELIEKLKKFRSYNIEVSLESIYSNNHYIRQGIPTQVILDNIELLMQHSSEQFQLVLRTVPQLLSVNNYNEYIEWAWNKKLSIQGMPLIEPKYLQISVLPILIRNQLKDKYSQTIKMIQQQSKESFITLATGRDVSRLHIQLIRECQSILNMLESPEPDNVEDLRKELVQWLIRWDQKYNLNALIEYPEYQEFLKQYGYKL